MDDTQTLELDTDVVQAPSTVAVGDDAKRLLNQLASRVDDLETQVKHLSEENADLQQDNKLLKKKVDSLETDYNELYDEYADLSETVSTLERDVSVLTSRADHLGDAVDDLEHDIHDTSDELAKRQTDLIRRIAACEGELGLEDWEAEANLGADASPIERFSEMPEEMREEKLKVAERRATLVWEFFDEWSQNVSRGKLIKSGQLKQLLSAAAGESLEYSQVYRTMEAFDENTPDEYMYIEPEEVGKSLVKEL